MRLQIPDFSIPGPDCYLTVDKNNVQLKVGDVVQSCTLPLRGREKRTEHYQPVKMVDGHLVIPHAGSHLVDIFVKTECEIVKNISKQS